MALSTKTVSKYDFLKLDPLNLLAYIHKYVKINTTLKYSIDGYVEAIDPISFSIFLIKLTENKREKMLLMGDTISGIEITDLPEDFVNITSTKAIQDNSKEIIERKKEVHLWLVKNLLPVVDVDGVLQVHHGELTIRPPYRTDDCFSNNTIILGRILHLLNNIPKGQIVK